MATGRVERIAELASVAWYLLWIAGMVRVTLDMSTWPFRILAAVTVAYIVYRFAAFLR